MSIIIEDITSLDNENTEDKENINKRQGNIKN